MTYSTEDAVFQVLPAEVLRPDRVAIDGKGGVSTQTFHAYQLRYKSSMDVDIRRAGLPLPSEPYHELLVAAEAHMVAGAIMRRFSTMQQQYKDAYATGNIFLRQYISISQLELGVALGGPSFVIDTDPLPNTSSTGFPEL